MAEHKPNSNRYKKETAERNNVQKVVSGGAKVKKKTGFSKLRDVLIADDIHEVTNSIIFDILIPAGKKTLLDIVETAMYGDSGRSRSRNSSSTVSYENCYRDQRRSSRQNANVRSAYSYDDIVFDTRGDAEMVLESMDEWIDRYETVSVGDLYDMAGITGKFTDYNYGWTNIRTANVARVRDGYIIRLPKPSPIN